MLLFVTFSESLRLGGPSAYMQDTWVRASTLTTHLRLQTDATQHSGPELVKYSSGMGNTGIPVRHEIVLWNVGV